MTRAWQEQGNNHITWQEHGKNLARAWQEHGKIMVRPWQEQGKNMARAWQAHDKSMAITWQGHGERQQKTTHRTAIAVSQGCGPWTYSHPEECPNAPVGCP
jgi:hypothetical protein